jgi:hypothetical protein
MTEKRRTGMERRHFGPTKRAVRIRETFPLGLRPRVLPTL